MVAFAYDEFAAGAPQWYKEVIAALGKDDVAAASKLAEEALGKKRELASLLAMVAVYLATPSGLSAAKPLAEEAVELAKGKEKAAALHYLAKVRYQDKTYGDAETAASEAISMYKSASDTKGEASVLSTKALMTVPASDKTLELANEALALFKAAKDTAGTASVLYTIITLKLAEGKSSQALNVAEELVRLFADAGDTTGQALALCKTAEVHIDLGGLQDALTKAQEAVELSAGDAKMKASSLNLAGKILGKGGMFDEAHKAVNASLNICRASKDKPGQATAICAAAAISQMQSEFGHAAYKLEQAANIYKQLDDKRQEAQMLESVAQMQLKTFWSLDDPSEPAAHCEKAMKIYGDLGLDMSAEAAYCLQTFAFALIASKRKEEGLEKAKDALSVCEENMDSVGEAAALITLAQVYWELKDKEQAAKLAVKAADVAVEAGSGADKEFAQELVENYSGNKGKGAKMADSSGMTDSSGSVIRSTNIFTYVHGVEHVLFTGFTVRGVIERNDKKKGKASSGSSVLEDIGEAVVSVQLSHSLDFQSLGAA